MPNLLFFIDYKQHSFAPENKYIMKTITSNRKVAVESKVGTVTKTFSNASSLVWNSKRRYK